MHSSGPTPGPCGHGERTVPPAEPSLKVIELWMDLLRRNTVREGKWEENIRRMKGRWQHPSDEL